MHFHIVLGTKDRSSKDLVKIFFVRHFQLVLHGEYSEEIKWKKDWGSVSSLELTL